MNTHRRQSSNGSFKLNGNDQNHFDTSFSRLENFMILSRLMQEEIMVPSKLKDKHFENDKVSLINSSGSDNSDEEITADVHDHYRFILLIRNQFNQLDPFVGIDENKIKELNNRNFKTIFDNLSYHYAELMSTLDVLANEAKAITEIYKKNV